MKWPDVKERLIAKDKKHTLTYNNGGTFSDHELTERNTEIDIYFVHPYHSWKRGCNENFIDLLIQFFQKS